jgi:hypothetical protein
VNAANRSEAADAIARPPYHIAGMSELDEMRKRLLELREEVTAKAAELSRKAMEALEKRGYDVRGKTIAEMKKIIRWPPTKPKSDG